MTALVVIEAHLGHWYVGGPIYLSPVLAVFVWLKWAEWRHRRQDEDTADHEQLMTDADVDGAQHGKRHRDPPSTTARHDGRGSD